MSRLYKLTDMACDSCFVLVADEEDETDAQAKWEVYRDANLGNPQDRAVKRVVLVAAADATHPEQMLVE